MGLLLAGFCGRRMSALTFDVSESAGDLDRALLIHCVRSLADKGRIAPLPCMSAEGAQPVEDSFVYNGNLAVDCLPYDTTELAMHEVQGWACMICTVVMDTLYSV